MSKPVVEEPMAHEDLEYLRWYGQVVHEGHVNLRLEDNHWMECRHESCQFLLKFINSRSKEAIVAGRLLGNDLPNIKTLYLNNEDLSHWQKMQHSRKEAMVIELQYAYEGATNFTSLIIHALSKADWSNLSKLRVSFADECAVVAAWKEGHISPDYEILR